jgi:hypothetical protein
MCKPGSPCHTKSLSVTRRTTDTTIPNTVDMATLSGFADLTGKIADGTIGTTASDTINTTGMQPFSVRGSTAHGGPSQKTNGPTQPLGLKWAHDRRLTTWRRPLAPRS